MARTRRVCHRNEETGRAAHGGHARRGVLLLEVVVALSILLVAIAICGAAIHNSLLSVKQGENITRAMMLSEEILARLDLGELTYDQEQEGTFRDRGIGDLTYELKITPVEQEPELLRVTVSILEEHPTKGDGETRPVLVTHALRAKPKPINMKNDFGMTDEQLKMLTDSIPGGAQMIDPENFDPTMLARLDMNSLTQLLPIIMAAMQSGQLSPQMLGGADAGGLPGGLPGGMPGGLPGGLPGGMSPGGGQPTGDGGAGGLPQRRGGRPRQPAGGS